MTKIKVEIPMPKPIALQSRRSALLIVDMQKDFAEPSGRLFVGESILSTIQPMKALLEKARRKGVRVIYTQDWHEPSDPEFEIWGYHCIKSTWGAEIIDELQQKPGDIVIRKKTYDPWYNTELEGSLRKGETETLIVTGTVSNICVLHTVAGGTLRGYRVVVPVDCISAITEYDQELAMRQFTFVYRAELTKEGLIEFN
jgi:nicotinamidase-related amidase